MKPRYKKPFVLLEILIGLGLLSMLLVFLFSFLAQNMRMEQKMGKARGALLERQNVQIRLQDLFTSLARTSLQSPLYTERQDNKESLVLRFDNGIDPDPAFSGPLVGRLYLEEQNLCLAIWPLEEDKKRPWRKEILLTHVTHVAYQFLGEKKETTTPFLPVTPTIGWLASWPKERTDAPSLIRLQLSQDGRPLAFAFRLPTSNPVITYKEGGFPS